MKQTKKQTREIHLETAFMEGMESRDNGAVYTKLVKAGKRTYFFDVKSTRQGDHYLTVTESKKRFSEDGRFTFEKHKIFLYREDFEKFMEAMQDAMGYIQSQPIPEGLYQQSQRPASNNDQSSGNQFTDVSFDDLNQ